MMAIIRRLDPLASIVYSDYVDDFYVSSRIEITDGFILSGATGRGKSPDAAVENCFTILTSVTLPRRLVVNAYGDDRREYLWIENDWLRIKVFD